MLKSSSSFTGFQMVSAMLSYMDMFDYFKKERTKIIEALEKLPNHEFTKGRELSFDSIKDVFVHTVMNEDTWLHYRASGVGEATKRKLEDFNNLEEIKQYIAEVDAKTAELFGKMTDQDLQKTVKRLRPDGTEDVYNLEQVLFQLPLEAIHHFGEIFGEFWKMNLSAPYYSYLAYSKEKTTYRQ